jgi:hypothetical protein
MRLQFIFPVWEMMLVCGEEPRGKMTEVGYWGIDFDLSRGSVTGY